MKNRFSLTWNLSLLIQGPTIFAFKVKNKDAKKPILQLDAHLD